MKVLGIIAEYNPFHLGHLHHLRESIKKTRPDYTLAVISGNFTQRGEAAIVDKWLRTRMALENGIDLVLELPTAYAVQSAEFFAHGGIDLLNKTGVVTHVSFGSEISDIESLKTAAWILHNEDRDLTGLIKDNLKQGMSYPRARSTALNQHIPSGISSEHWREIIENPNSILAVEYIKAILRTNSSINPVVITRIQSDYNSRDLNPGISSATSIRRELLVNGLSSQLALALPKSTFDILSKAVCRKIGPVENKDFEGIILSILRRSSAEEIGEWMDVSEGLENRFRESAIKSVDLESLLSDVKTRRYVHTRLQRILIHGLIGLTREKFYRIHRSGGNKYIRILGFSPRATLLLKELKKRARIPIITKGTHYRKHSWDVGEMFLLDVLATDLYSLAVDNPKYRAGGRDFTQTVIQAPAEIPMTLFT